MPVITRQFRVDLDLEYRTQLVEFIGTMNVLEYLLSYEISSDTQKPHWQGWLKFDTDVLTEATYRAKCTRFCKPIGLSYKKKQYCFGVISDIPTYQSYICNNEVKGLLDLDSPTVITNILDDNFVSSLTPFVDPKKLKNKVDKDKPFILRLIDSLDVCVSHTDIMGEVTIDYKRIPDIVYSQFSRFYKSMDLFIFKRHVATATMCLEDKYRSVLAHDPKFRSHFMREFRKSETFFDML